MDPNIGQPVPQQAPELEAELEALEIGEPQVPFPEHLRELPCCPVCMTTQQNLHILPCGHPLCDACWPQVANRRCPTCQTRHGPEALQLNRRCTQMLEDLCHLRRLQRCCDCRSCELRMDDARRPTLLLPCLCPGPCSSCETPETCPHCHRAVTRRIEDNTMLQLLEAAAPAPAPAAPAPAAPAPEMQEASEDLPLATKEEAMRAITEALSERRWIWVENWGYNIEVDHKHWRTAKLRGFLDILRLAMQLSPLCTDSEQKAFVEGLALPSDLAFHLDTAMKHRRRVAQSREQHPDMEGLPAIYQGVPSELPDRGPMAACIDSLARQRGSAELLKELLEEGSREELLPHVDEWMRSSARCNDLQALRLFRTYKNS